MARSRAVTWLGRPQAHPANRGGGRVGLPGHSGAGRCASAPEAQLIDQAAKLCARAQRHFDLKGDPEARQFMERFAVLLVDAIGAHVVARKAR